MISMNSMVRTLFQSSSAQKIYLPLSPITGQGTQNQNEEFVDENGIRTVIEYTVNDEGKKVKVRS